MKACCEIDAITSVEYRTKGLKPTSRDGRIPESKIARDGKYEKSLFFQKILLGFSQSYLSKIFHLNRVINI